MLLAFGRIRERFAARGLVRLRGRFRGRRGILAFLAVMGPGLIAGIAGNDAGGITTYSVIGATTGLSLLWLFPITIVILAIVQEMAARLGVVTGQGLSDLIRDRFGVRPTAFAMLVLLVANVANTVAEFSGAAAALEIFGISRYLVVPIVAVAIWALVLKASYRTVERVFLAVIVVFFAYIASAILSRPRLGRGRPGPRDAVVRPRRRRSLLLMVALVGTTITPYMQFYLTSAVAEKGIGEDELRARAGRRGRRVDLDQRHRDLHRGRHRDDHLRRPAGRSRPRPTRRGPSSRSPAGWPRRSSRSGCSGRACWPPRSCRSRPRS